jgi:hypothetical protein
MSTDKNNDPQQIDTPQKAQTGNASNPSPDDRSMDDTGNNQLLDKNAEKYIRESASIEDLPDARDQQEMEDQLSREE